MNTKRKLLSNVIVIAAIELMMFQFAMALQGIALIPVARYMMSHPDIDSEFLGDATAFASFIIPILFFLIFMRVTNRETLKIFSMGNSGKRIKNASLGILAGGLFNSVICLVVWLSGSVTLTFSGFSSYLLIILLCVFIQCTAEEVALRGFLPAYLEETHRWDVVAMTGGFLFIFHHVFNMMEFGFSYIFCLNVFLFGIVFYLLLKISGSFWICCGFHTGWNFAQQYIFGLPNSGNSSGLAVCRGKDAVSCFFFDPIYGNEGSLFCTFMSFALICLLLAIIKKKSAGGINVLNETILPQS